MVKSSSTHTEEEVVASKLEATRHVRSESPFFKTRVTVKVFQMYHSLSNVLRVKQHAAVCFGDRMSLLLLASCLRFSPCALVETYAMAYQCAHYDTESVNAECSTYLLRRCTLKLVKCMSCWMFFYCVMYASLPNVCTIHTR